MLLLDFLSVPLTNKVCHRRAETIACVRSTTLDRMKVLHHYGMFLCNLGYVISSTEEIAQFHDAKRKLKKIN